MDLFNTKPSILVVDDEPANIDLLKGILESDYQITAAIDGQRAVAAVQANKPDLILLDVMMPDMDGYAVCSRLKADDRYRDIPIIFVTAKNQPEDEQKGLGMGADDYITKPISPAIVKARIASRLELYENRRRMQQMLSDTLLGSLKVFGELLALTNTEAAARARRLRRIVRSLVNELKLDDQWEYEAAVTVSQLGCMGLPEDQLLTLYKGEPLTGEQQDQAIEHLYQEQFNITSNMFSAIPNLADVAVVVRRAREPLPTDRPAPSLNDMEDLKRGALILHVATLYDQEYLKGTPHKQIIADLRSSDKAIPESLLDALEKSRQPKPKEAEVRIEHLQPGMVLREDLVTRDGVRAMPKGFEITDSTLKHMRSFSGTGFSGMVKVYEFEEAFSQEKANPFDGVTFS